MKTDFTRRDMLKLSALGAGSAVVAGGLTGCPVIPPQEVFPIGEPLDENEMRITFMGTSVVPRQKQECNSVFVDGNYIHFYELNRPLFITDHQSRIGYADPDFAIRRF